MNISNSSQMEMKIKYKVGDIIKCTRWTKGDTHPKIFKCIVYDAMWGVVWYDYNGKKDSIGLAYVKKANPIEKFIFKLTHR